MRTLVGGGTVGTNSIELTWIVAQQMRKAMGLATTQTRRLPLSDRESVARAWTMASGW
jgi:hypothetical protein